MYNNFFCIMSGITGIICYVRCYWWQIRCSEGFCFFVTIQYSSIPTKHASYGYSYACYGEFK